MTKTPEELAAMRKELEEGRPQPIGRQCMLLAAYDEQAREIERLQTEARLDDVVDAMRNMIRHSPDPKGEFWDTLTHEQVVEKVRAYLKGE